MRKNTTMAMSHDELSEAYEEQEEKIRELQVKAVTVDAAVEALGHLVFLLNDAIEKLNRLEKTLELTPDAHNRLAITRQAYLDVLMRVRNPQNNTCMVYTGEFTY